MKLTTIGVGLDYYSTYGQLCLSRLLVVSQLVAGRVRWAFGGCCTAVVVSLGILPYIVHRTVGYNLPGVPLSLLALDVSFDIRTGRSMTDGMTLPRVITNELLHCGLTHSEHTRGSARA